VLAVYAPPEGVFFVTDSCLGENCREISLRLSPARNGQKKLVRMANDFRVL
jgi:hypothetical protein